MTEEEIETQKHGVARVTQQADGEARTWTREPRPRVRSQGWHIFSEHKRKWEGWRRGAFAWIRIVNRRRAGRNPGAQGFLASDFTGALSREWKQAPVLGFPCERVEGGTSLSWDTQQHPQKVAHSANSAGLALLAAWAWWFQFFLSPGNCTFSAVLLCSWCCHAAQMMTDQLQAVLSWSPTLATKMCVTL